MLGLFMEWALFGLSQALLGASVMMLAKGTLPPPFTHKKASPVFATFQMIVGLTMMIWFGREDLLKDTLGRVFGL
jgi:hypothetical protein